MNLFQKLLPLYNFLLLLMFAQFSQSIFICRIDDFCECKNISSTEFAIKCNNGRYMELKSSQNDTSKIHAIEFQEIGSQLRKDDFKNFTEIRTLAFYSDISLGTVDQDLIRDLSKLETLYLQGAYFKIQPGFFNNSKKLEYLTMVNNVLTDTGPNVFEGLENVKSIGMFNNKLTLNPDLIKNFKHLEALEISENQITSIPERFFEFNQNLEFIRLQSNNLNKIPKNIFKNLKILRSIYLDFNELKTLPYGSFNYSNRIENLDLSYNAFESISENIFAGLFSLKSLYLANNQITYISQIAFQDLKNLTEINLSENKLSTFNEEARVSLISPFKFSRFLKKINLANNKISSIYKDWTELWLPKIILTNNTITDLQIKDIGYYRLLDVSFNRISRISISLTDLDKLPLMSSSDDAVIRTIVMGKNPLECGCEVYDFLRIIKKENRKIEFKVYSLFCHGGYHNNTEVNDLDYKTFGCKIQFKHFSEEEACVGNCDCWFKPFDKSIIIDCANKNLLKLPKLLSVENASKIELHLQSNKIEELPDLTQPGYNKVKFLDLSSNLITKFDENILNSNIKELNLLNNNISSFLNADTLKRYFRKIQNLKMSWHCNCFNVQLLSKESNEMNFYGLKNFTCYKKNISIYQFKNDYCSNEFRSLTIIIILATFLALVIGIAIVLLTRYWFEIKIFLNSNKLAHWWIIESDFKTGKKYDIFLSFCHKDEKFVMEKILPRIEGREKGYTICIHSRDWLPGEWIHNNIIKSVDESKCTVIILTENFLQSIWGMTELRVAYIQLLLAKETKIIIILYEKVRNCNNLELELNSYLMMSTLIEWKDPLFWEKLFKALPNRSI